MASETSSVDLVFHVFVSWGRKAIVVRAPAMKPIIVTVSISRELLTRFVLETAKCVADPAISPCDMIGADGIDSAEERQLFRRTANEIVQNRGLIRNALRIDPKENVA